MAPAGPEMRWVQGDHAARTVAVPMILDGGDAARVAVINCGCAPFVGMRFMHERAMWEVTRAQDHLRGWVAQPAFRADPNLTRLRLTPPPRCVREA